MHIPEMFYSDEMKETKYQMKCLSCLPKDTKWKKELKTEHNIAAQTAYKRLYIQVHLNKLECREKVHFFL